MIRFLEKRAIIVMHWKIVLTSIWGIWEAGECLGWKQCYEIAPFIGPPKAQNKITKDNSSLRMEHILYHSTSNILINISDKFFLINDSES